VISAFFEQHKDLNPRLRQALRAKMRRFLIGFLVVGTIIWLTFSLWRHHVIDAFQTTLHKSVIAFSHQHGLVVEEITVIGRARQDSTVMMAQLALAKGQPLFALDLAGMREKLLQLPWLKDVTIARHFPHEIIITLQERVPTALWQYQGKIFVIDDEGYPIEEATRTGPYAAFPLVVGGEAQKHVGALMVLLRAEPVIAEKLEAAMRVGGRRWDLKLKNGVVIKLPEENVEKALATVVAMHKIKEILNFPLNFVDVRTQNKTILSVDIEQEKNKEAPQNKLKI
jgi:cell division protein FtsQ